MIISNMLLRFTRVCSPFVLSGVARFGKLKQSGRYMVEDLPQSELPSRPKEFVDPERLRKEIFYEMTNYERSDRPPRCKYFSVQRRGRVYHVYDAYYYPLGRMMSRVASAIRGRLSPHHRTDVAVPKQGDVVVIVNIDDPLLTGKKMKSKVLRYHTGFIGTLREHSYRAILNKKPELIYHHLLKRMMPKNKTSLQYFENLILVRGPSHSIAFLPQFAPDENLYEPPTHTNILELFKNDPNAKLLGESSPGIAKEILGRELELGLTPREKRIRELSREHNVAQIDELHEVDPPTQKTTELLDRRIKALKTREKRFLERYRRFRAPYNTQKKKGLKKPLEYFDSEKKARKHPRYEELANEDLEEVDDIVTADDLQVYKKSQPAPATIPFQKKK